MPERYPFAPPFDDAAAAEQALKNGDPAEWERRGEAAALELFRAMSARVPAYKDFLKKHKVDADSIRSISDFKKLPTLDKNNYLRAYPLAALSWNGALADSYAVYASTSGSTGEPFYFPRGLRQTDQYALLAELYLRAQFKLQERKTLYVDCFAMGAWIGGLFTAQAVERLASRGKYSLHLITPGLAKEEALKAVRALGPSYDQVIIGGYPPYVKDLIDHGIAEGMHWKRYNVGFVFSAEGFSEKFRDHVAEAVGQEDVLRGSLNHYGTVDLGTMAYETPYAAVLRRAALADKKLFKELFGEAHRLPTLAQYLPEHFYFEAENSGLLCSADAGLPLIRYDLKDQGGLWSFDELASKVKPEAVADTVFKLPFVYLYERKDFTVVLYGANIYPEHVRRALEGKACAKFATGKCTIRIVESRLREPRLEVNVELKRGLKSSKTFAKLAEREIIATLLADNAEYRSNHSHLPRKMRPRIKLWPFSDPKYFSGRGKQKWSSKS
jgi:phenylacetate-CoA ligase